MKYKTDWISKEDINRKWHLVDVKDQILGRAATKVANLLIGKSKVTYVPNMDCGDYVVVVNSANIKLTRGKEKKKMYYRHSGYMGNLKETRFDQMIKKNPDYVFRQAVKRMLPQTKLGDTMITRLFIYPGAEHKQVAQKPEEYKL